MHNVIVSVIWGVPIFLVALFVAQAYEKGNLYRYALRKMSDAQYALLLSYVRGMRRTLRWLVAVVSILSLMHGRELLGLMKGEIP
jgi:hypothetical protein